VDILIVAPSAGEVRTGNRCTAQQWASLLEALGHRARIGDAYRGEGADVLVALHAAKSCAAIPAFRHDHPGARIVVALTGTDVYPEPGPEALDSLRKADRIVGLQPRVRDRIPAELRDRLRVIVQAATEPRTKDGASSASFDVCVVGHLRQVKDPLRAAAAARLLPADSRIRIRHAGAILEARYRDLVAREQAKNPRYAWLGELGPDETQRLLASSRLSVLSSYFEGGARVVGESVVAGTPVLAARNDATRSLLGDDYPGLYDAGETRQLADLMRRAETDAAFLADLHERATRLRAQFDPRREREAWADLLAELQAVPSEGGKR